MLNLGNTAPATHSTAMGNRDLYNTLNSHRLKLPAAPPAQRSLNPHLPSPVPALVVGQVYRENLAQILISAPPEQPLTRAQARLDSAWKRMGKAKPAAKSQPPKPFGGDSSTAGSEGIPVSRGKCGQNHRTGMLPLGLNHAEPKATRPDTAQTPCPTPHPTGVIPQIPARISHTIPHPTVLVSISSLLITNPPASG